MALRVFFRRVEALGAELVPSSGPVIFVLNHPNALIDPLLLLCFAPRPVSFLAKAPLFRMPFVGFFVRAFDSIPVHRRQDVGSDLSRNRETFARARQLLARGGTLALFPEGASHDQPKLLELKTGAARIALGAAAMAHTSLQIVPGGLTYTWKQRFRSSALLSFGHPIRVEPVALDENGEPPPEPVRELTGRIEEALAPHTLQAETHGALDLVRRAERIFSVEEDGGPADLARRLELRKRFVEGHRRLAEADPARLTAIEARVERFEAERKAAGLSLEHLTPERLDAREAVKLLGRNLGALLLLPLAAAGAVLHYPAYRLAGFLGKRVARAEDNIVATVKVASSMLLFPLTWCLAGALATKSFSPWAGAVALLAAPLSGYAAIRVTESLDEIFGRARALARLVFRGYSVKRLLGKRRAIRDEILRIADELEDRPPR